MPVPRLRGCTIRLPQSRASSSHWQSVHHSRCCWATIVQTRSGAIKRRARAIASSSSECPPCSEQYCFGTEVPHGLVVSSRSRLPSPPARIRDQTCCASGMAAFLQTDLQTDVIVVAYRRRPVNTRQWLQVPWNCTGWTCVLPTPSIRNRRRDFGLLSVSILACEIGFG